MVTMLAAHGSPPTRSKVDVNGWLEAFAAHPVIGTTSSSVSKSRGGATRELGARVLSSTAIEIRRTSSRASGQQLRRHRIQSPRPSPLPDRASRATLATAPNSVIGCHVPQTAADERN
ncbi:hypothetical protein E2562_018012 [Oryza meyeriana var. granulata]|uniref:Uncharacterized protein n=1 Tax=Oryza meyeriana var. granulata TaxID=110450 RepID=A0A6G1F974_9ORYZ|nr:hypothetical protein E2562_018012 [Oryza meyeriana var. granulata]